jgi:hypothetical protein
MLFKVCPGWRANPGTIYIQTREFKKHIVTLPLHPKDKGSNPATAVSSGRYEMVIKRLQYAF